MDRHTTFRFYLAEFLRISQFQVLAETLEILKLRLLKSAFPQLLKMTAFCLSIFSSIRNPSKSAWRKEFNRFLRFTTKISDALSIWYHATCSYMNLEKSKRWLWSLKFGVQSLDPFKVWRCKLDLHETGRASNWTTTKWLNLRSNFCSFK